MFSSLFDPESTSSKSVFTPKIESPRDKLNPEKILMFRKATVPAPFDLKIDRIIQKRNKHLLVSTQTYSSQFQRQATKEFRFKKRNLYGALSPDPSLHQRDLKTCNPEMIRRLSIRETFSPRTSLKHIMIDNSQNDLDSVARQTYGRLKINLKLSPRILNEKESRWSPKLTVKDLARLI